MKNRFTGLLIVVIISLLLLFIFYGKIVLSLNTTFLSTEGDGIQSYFNTCYQVKHNASWMYSYSMNYPYGEVAFYTLSQPLVAGPIKLISNHIADISGYTIAIINFLILFSIILAAIFLYLIFVEIGLPVITAILPSIGMAFLSPQIDRFGGHFTLAYVYAIPSLLYLMLMFHKYKKIIYSVLTGMVLFILITGHIYFAGFFSAVIIFYWLFTPFTPKNPPLKKYLNILLHISLQLIIPLLVYYLITGYFADLSPDRPSKPYGFLDYRAFPASVFLPLWVDYGKILYKIKDFSYVQWEGIAYIGLVASIGFWVLPVIILKSIIKCNWYGIIRITDNHFLNIAFWASIATLLYSFGIPFIWHLDFLVDYIGPLKQMRALGRFSWLFFYTINIVVFYLLWQWQQNGRIKYVKQFILILSILILFTDVFFYLKNRQNLLLGHFPAWSDSANTLPENQWVKRIDPDQYQSIIPLPFYHMGSDNYGVPTRCNMLANSFLVSIKTGLPVTAIYLSRASVSQSLKNISLVMEPYRKLDILNDFPDNRPFLIVAARCSDFTAHEIDLRNMGVKVDSSTSFDLYRLDFDSLLTIHQKKSEQVFNDYENKRLRKRAVYFRSDSVAVLNYYSFDDSSKLQGYRGNARQISGRSEYILYDDKIRSNDTLNLILSFWYSPINIDLFPKTRIKFEHYNNQGMLYDYRNLMVTELLQTTDGPWGLVEYHFKPASRGDRLKITLYNTLIGRKQSYLIDELLIRREEYDVYCTDDNFISKNNRYYYRQ
jgi:hypothetical protein